MGSGRAGFAEDSTHLREMASLRHVLYVRPTSLPRSGPEDTAIPCIAGRRRSNGTQCARRPPHPGLLQRRGDNISMVWVRTTHLKHNDARLAQTLSTAAADGCRIFARLASSQTLRFVPEASDFLSGSLQAGSLVRILFDACRLASCGSRGLHPKPSSTKFPVERSPCSVQSPQRHCPRIVV